MEIKGRKREKEREREREREKKLNFLFPLPVPPNHLQPFFTKYERNIRKKIFFLFKI